MPGSSCAALLMLAGVAFAQNATIEGSVVNAISGEPLPRAHVMLRGDASTYGAISDVTGKFSISNLPPGLYRVTAERVGFVIGVPDSGSGLNLHPGDQRTDLRLKLMPFGSITGRVVNADGEPVDRIKVSAEIGADTSNYSVTDDRGVYRIGGLRPGRYRVHAVPQAVALPPEVRSDGTIEMHNIATWHPNSATAKAAGRVDVQPGAEASGIDIHMGRGPIVRLSGKVTGLPEGRGRTMAGVEIQKSDSTLPLVAAGMGVVQEDGYFQAWRLDPGPYTLSAYCYSPDRQLFRSAPLEVQVGDTNVDKVELHLIAPADLAGRVEYDADPGGARQIALVDADGRVDVAAAEIASDNAFQVPNVPAGRYRVRVSPGPAYVKAVRVGPTETAGSILDLRYGAAGITPTILLSTAAGSLSGTVADEKGPAAGVRVTLVPEDPKTGLYNSATTNAAGAYTMARVLPGRYKLIAWDGSSGRTIDDFEEDMESIEVAAGDKLTKDLKVARR